jgi:hypothetical protein
LVEYSTKYKLRLKLHGSEISKHMNVDIEVSEEEIAAFYRLIGHNVKKLRQEQGLSQIQISISNIYTKLQKF